MLKPKYLEQLPNSMIELFSQAEQDILADMARRISKYDYWIPSVEHQRKKLVELGNFHSFILKALSSRAGKTEEELKRLMQEAGQEALSFDIGIYEEHGLDPPPLAVSKAQQAVLTAGYKKTAGLFRNLTSTTANTATKQFEDALDRAYMQITTGAFDYGAAIRTAIKDLARQGVGAVQYPSGHVDTIEVAVRRAAVTGVNQTALQLQSTLADEMGCDLLETTAHAGARPEHTIWQGRVFSRSGKSEKYPDFVRETGYGTGAGLGGWNCRHSFFPYFEGSPRAYTPEMLKDYEAKKYRYNGTSMTEYEATQQQRYIERQIRHWKRENAAMQAAGLDTAESAAKVSQWQGTMRDFLGQTGLKRQADRERISGMVDNLSERDIIKLGKTGEDALQKLSFDEVSKYRGKLSDRAVRKWYKYHDEQIPDMLDRSKPLEDQARQACELRNQHRTQARDLMRDQEARRRLDETEPNRAFEELVTDKMKRKGLTRQQAYEDILQTATKTRKSVNKSLGLE